MKLAENIRRLRKSNNITQESLARTLNVSTGAVSKWESELSVPDISLIIELAELFEVSVDYLLGYEMKKDSYRQTVKKMKQYYLDYRYDEGIPYAEKALVKYPNDFNVVYYTAAIWFTKAFLTREKTVCLRAVELFTHADSLLEQNTDEAISHLSIYNGISRLYSFMGDTEKCIDILKANNPGGVNNARIGNILADIHRPEEAMQYLSKAISSYLMNIQRTVMGFADIFFQLEDYDAALSSLLWLESIYSSCCEKEETTLYTKLNVLIYELCAELYILKDNLSEAEIYLKKAVHAANEYDSNPENAKKQPELFIKMESSYTPDFRSWGNTAADILSNRIEKEGRAIPQMNELWKKVQAEQ